MEIVFTGQPALSTFLHNGSGHSLLVGRPGLGKTMACKMKPNILLKEKNEEWELIQYNASDERGIDFVREKIGTLVRNKPIAHDGRIILLDEADGLTKPAQEALRGVIDSAADWCVFFLTANDEGSLTPALKSRMNTYRFTPYKAAAVKELLSLDDEKCESIARFTDGDMREILRIHEDIERGVDVDTIVLNLQKEHQFNDAALCVASEEWLDLRRHIDTLIDGGRTAHYIMAGLHRHVRTLGLDLNEWFRFADVWGEIVMLMHTWPLDTASLMDVFIARLSRAGNEVKK